MAEITPESIMAAVATARPRTVVLLKRGPNFDTTADLQMEHLKHIFALRAAGQQVITLPVTDAGELVGISLFVTADKEEAAVLAAADPGVKAGRFTFEVLGCMAIPGDSVPVSGGGA